MGGRVVNVLSGIVLPITLNSRSQCNRGIPVQWENETCPGRGLFYYLRQASFSYCGGMPGLHQDRVGIEDCVVIVLDYGCHGLGLGIYIAVRFCIAPAQDAGLFYYLRQASSPYCGGIS